MFKTKFYIAKNVKESFAANVVSAFQRTPKTVHLMNTITAGMFI